MGSLLERLPSLATTGIGSLPFTRPVDAATHVFSAYELPFCPQLPRAYGDMLTEWLGADPGRCGWAPDRDRQLPAAWDAFILELTGRPPVHRLVKLQVTGPVTLAMALDRTAHGDQLRGLAGAISTWLAATVAEQVAGLAELGFDAVLVIDEPGVAAAGLGAADIGVWDALRVTAGAWGLHVCCEVPWDLVDAAQPDLISFDLTHDGLCGPARWTLTRLVARGGRVIWGAFDPAAPSSVNAAVALITSAFASFKGSLDAPAASLISASCGTGLVSIANELVLAARVRSAAATIRTGVTDAERVPGLRPVPNRASALDAPPKSGNAPRSARDDDHSMSEPFDTDTSDNRGLPVASPCVGVCVIDESTSYCQGCQRTLSEVAAWRSYSLISKT